MGCCDLLCIVDDIGLLFACLYILALIQLTQDVGHESEKTVSETLKRVGRLSKRYTYGAWMTETSVERGTEWLGKPLASSCTVAQRKSVGWSKISVTQSRYLCTKFSKCRYTTCCAALVESMGRSLRGTSNR